MLAWLYCSSKSEISAPSLSIWAWTSFCVAAATGTECGHALDQMRRTFKAEVHFSAEIDVAALAGRSPDRVAVDAGAVLAKH